MISNSSIYYESLVVCMKIIKFIFGCVYRFGKNSDGRREGKVQKII